MASLSGITTRGGAEAMSQEVKKYSGDNLSDLPALPDRVVTADGQVIEITSSVWRARPSPDGGRYRSVNWSLAMEQGSQRGILTTRAWYLVKLYLADRLSHRNIGTIQNEFNTVLAFSRWLAKQDTSLWLAKPEKGFNWSDYSESLARAFLSYGVNHTAKKGHDFWALRAFYSWGVTHQLPDFSLALLPTLRHIKAPSALKGQHVRFRDVINGPFSTDERHAIKQALDREQGTLHDRIIVRLFYELGINPYAAILLKNKDLHWYEAHGTRYFQLDVPRIKKRLVVRETKRRPISPTLGDMLYEIQEAGPDDPLLFWLPKINPEQGIAEAMSRFAKRCNLISPRTSGRLKLNPRRFRYTLATHLAEEGATDLQIAEVLDHSDLSHVPIYTETTSFITGPVARATDPILIPLVHLFLGIIVESDQSPMFVGLPNHIIPGAPPHIPQVPLDIGGVGRCGRNLLKDGLCKLFPPLSCYTCPFFAALRAGPHQQLYQGLEAYLEAHRDRLDRRIVLQLEEVLCAIREVLDLINRPDGNQGGDSHAR